MRRVYTGDTRLSKYRDGNTANDDGKANSSHTTLVGEKTNTEVAVAADNRAGGLKCL
jgi:hypothetical protein